MLRESRKFCAASASQAHPSFLLGDPRPQLAHRSFLPGHRSSEPARPSFRLGLRSFPLGGPSSEQSHPSFLLAQPSSEQGGESLRRREPRFRPGRRSIFHRARREHQRRPSFRQRCRRVLLGDQVDRSATLSPGQTIPSEPHLQRNWAPVSSAGRFLSNFAKRISEKMVPLRLSFQPCKSPRDDVDFAAQLLLMDF
jgi:hypothetical protein